MNIFGWKREETQSQTLDRLRKELLLATEKNRRASEKAIILAGDLRDKTEHLLEVMGRR